MSSQHEGLADLPFAAVSDASLRPRHRFLAARELQRRAARMRSSPGTPCGPVRARVLVNRGYPPLQGFGLDALGTQRQVIQPLMRVYGIEPGTLVPPWCLRRVLSPFTAWSQPLTSGTDLHDNLSHKPHWTLACEQ